jgi:hypothetical protein
MLPHAKKWKQRAAAEVCAAAARFIRFMNPRLNAFGEFVELEVVEVFVQVIPGDQITVLADGFDVAFVDQIQAVAGADG